MGQSIKIYYNYNTEHPFLHFFPCSFRIPEKYVSEGTCGEIKLVKGKSLAFPIKSTQFASQI